MKKNTVKTTIFAALGCLALESSPLLAGDCSENTISIGVEGKIFNNAQIGGSTLGSLSLKTDTFGKMKCGIIGVPAGAAPAEAGTIPEGIAFTHTISCDDNFEPYPGIILHSGMTLNTTGTTEEGPYCTFDSRPPSDSNPLLPGAIVAQSFSFQEKSIPMPGSGRGVFGGPPGTSPAAGGEIIVTGTFSCYGTIDMKFEGRVCMPNP